MKKFITYISMQPERNLLKVNYEAVDNNQLKNELFVYFPISVVAETYAEKDEQIEILCIMEKENASIMHNRKLLETEIQEIAGRKGFQATFKDIIIAKEERVKSHLDTFGRLINLVDDGDELYVCCTYGTKPIPIIEMMAMNYAYRTKDNVSVKLMVYGKVERIGSEMKHAYLYDITSLFFMTQIVNKLADNRTAHPEKLISNILNVEEE